MQRGADKTPRLHATVGVQVAVAVGPVRSPDGKPGFQSGMSSERVDADGVSNVAAAATKQLPRASLVSDPVMQASDFASWQAKDDTVMGGTSSSKIEAGSGNGAPPLQTLSVLQPSVVPMWL